MSPSRLSITIDTNDWPVVRVIVGAGVDEAATRAFIGAFREIAERGEPFITIFDHTRTELLPLPAIFAARDLMPSLVPGLKANCRAMCSLTPNPVIRAIVRGVLHVVPFPIVPVVVGTEEELQQWIAEQRRALGLPPSAVALHK